MLRKTTRISFLAPSGYTDRNLPLPLLIKCTHMKYPFGRHLWAYGTTDLCRTLNQTLCVPPINSKALETTCKALRAFRNVLPPPHTKKKKKGLVEGPSKVSRQTQTKPSAKPPGQSGYLEKIRVGWPWVANDHETDTRQSKINFKLITSTVFLYFSLAWKY